MTTEQSLLDLLAIQMRCEYLSDLHYLTGEQQRYLAAKLERLTTITAVCFIVLTFVLTIL